MALTLREFIRRFFLHAVPRGFVRIRYFGLFANRDRTARIELCRIAIAGGESTDPLGEEADPEDLAQEPVERACTRLSCPARGKVRLLLVEEIPRQPLFHRGRPP